MPKKKTPQNTFIAVMLTAQGKGGGGTGAGADRSEATPNQGRPVRVNIGRERHGSLQDDMTGQVATFLNRADL